MRALSHAAALLVLASPCAGFAVGPATRLAQQPPLQRAAVAMMSDAPAPEAKVTIRTPETSAASGSSSSSSSGTKIKVRVKTKEEREAAAKEREAAAAAAAAELAEEDSDTTTSVTIKAAPPPPPAPEGPKLSQEEQDLLEATQRANCSKILEALQTGVNPNIRDPKGRTPLHFMSGVGLAPGVVLLIHFGADVEARDEDGLAPIHMAAGYANAQTLRVLVAAGADANVTATAQGTPLSVVLQLGEYQLKAFIEEKKGALQRFKKKDDKLEKLKACLEVLEDPQAVRDDTKWDDYLEDVLKTITVTAPKLEEEAAAA